MRHWCLERREDLLALAGKTSQLLVYNEEILNEVLFDFFSVTGIQRIFQAVEFACHPRVLRKVFEMGAGFLCRSRRELNHLLGLFPELDPQRLLFAPGKENRPEYAYAMGLGLQAVVGSGSLKEQRHVFKRENTLLRIDLKGGIPFSGDRRRDFTEAVGGVFVEPHGPEAVPGLKEIIALIDKQAGLDHVSILCLGGGAGLPVHPQEDRIEVPSLAEDLGDLTELPPGLRLWVEPGRYLVSHAGVLLTSAGQMKRSGGFRPVSGGPHAVYNLTSGAEDPIAWGTDDTGCRTGGTTFEAQEEDILAVTNMGSRSGTAPPLTECYMNARRICQVKL